MLIVFFHFHVAALGYGRIHRIGWVRYWISALPLKGWIELRLPIFFRKFDFTNTVY